MGELDAFKVKEFEGVLPARYRITAKLNGVQAILFPETGAALSRAGKHLYHLEDPIRKLRAAGVTQPVPVEVFIGSFENTLSAVRSLEGEMVPSSHCYDLLFRSGGVLRPPPEVPMEIFPSVQEALERYMAAGYEGLMIQDLDTGDFLRMKPFLSMDVMVTDVIAGRGKHTGRLGALMTPCGKVGTGFTDAQREEIWQHPDSCIGHVIEVKYQHLTPDGKFRHPVFVRLRPDKD